MTKLVWAFDLATRTGFAYGPPNARPVSGTWLLKDAGGTNAAAGGNLLRHVTHAWSKSPPDLVVKEAPIYPERMRELENAWHSIAYTHGLHMLLESMCELYGVSFSNVQASTWRKHFIGADRLCDRRWSKTRARKETKLAAVRRCHLLGYMPSDVGDVDQAEACGVWDYGVHAIAKSQTLAGRELVLFGEEPRA